MSKYFAYLSSTPRFFCAMKLAQGSHQEAVCLQLHGTINPSENDIQPSITSNHRRCEIVLFYELDHGVPLTQLTLITIATGTYLMNGYEIVKVYTRSPLVGKQLKELCSHLFPHLETVFTPLFHKLF